MIYVFLVDTGTMMTFDMNLALESVEVLKGAIQRAVRVPPDKQVLLASGGETLDSAKRVCHYSAGTDTSPIFLFSKVAIEGTAPPTPSVDCAGDDDLKAQVEGCLNMPATYNTVVARTQLAQQFYEHAREMTRTCRQLVHDQHLQQQGWAAVVANLEDIVAAFKTRHEAFQQNFVEYLSGREEKVALLQCFDEDLKLLARIPVFPELLGKTEEEEKEDEEEEEEAKKKKKKKRREEGEATTEEEEEEEEGHGPLPHMSLLDWISAKDSQSDVRQIAELCFRGLTQISEGLLEQLGAEVTAVVREADRPQMKEVKGLGERLCGLEQLMQEAGSVVQEQCNFSQALLKNQDRAGKVNDPSIFPDLCTSHRKNLMHMLKNHQKLQDIKRRCIKAKEELSENLHVRLKWIMYIERKLYEADTRVSMHQESVRRLGGLLQVVEQIHRAPRVYAAAITEVARRQAFSRGFLQWASELSSQSGEVWRKEVEARRDFFQEFSSHFLASLFPGMEDLPPDFATRLPSDFDVELPKVTEQNIMDLRRLLPELSHFLVVGEVVAVPPLLHHITTTTTTTTIKKDSQEGEREGDEASGNAYMKDGSTHMYASAVASTSAHEKERAHEFEMSEEAEEKEEEEEDKKKRGSVKTKQHFAPGVDDFPKHIRLDQNRAPSTTTTTTTSTTSTTDCDLILSDIYIEDSFPFSCEEEEEEEEGGGGALEGVLGMPPPTLQARPLIGQVSTNQDKEIMALQAELSGARVEVDRLRDRLGQLGDLRGQVNALRDKVQMEGSSYLSYVSQVSSSIVDLLLQVQEENVAKRREEEEEGRRKVENVHEQLKNAHGEINAYRDQLSDAHRRTDVYRGQLEDAHREIEVYMDQLQRQEEGLQQAATEAEEARQRVEIEWRKEVQAVEERRKEEVKKLTLEHEVEMEGLRQQLGTLRQSLVASLEGELEEKVRERLQEEKERIVKILEASFAEREKNALEAQRLELSQRLSQEKEEALEDTRRQLSEERRLDLERQRRETVEEKEQYLGEARRHWEEEKAEEMERRLAIVIEESRREVEEERRKHRHEMEVIRSRFRMMTTTTSTTSPSNAPFSSSPSEESPSSPPSSLSSGRWEGLDRLREELNKEREKEIEERLSLAREEERKKVEEEKQMEFSETIRAVTQDKERVIEDLKIRIKLLTEECERRRGGGGEEEGRGGAGGGGGGGREEEMAQRNLDLKNQVTALQSQVTRLESDLARAKRFSFVTQSSAATSSTEVTAMSASATSDDPRRQHRDSQDLREYLPHAATSLLDSGSLSLSSCQPGNVVLVVWDAAHSHYKVLLEGNASQHLHFLHSDAYLMLGLSRDNPQQKMFCAAEVMSKEFCQAKKDDNRFKVPKGTKFYRVIARPWSYEGCSGAVAGGSGAVTPQPTTTTTATPSTTTATTATATGDS